MEDNYDGDDDDNDLSKLIMMIMKFMIMFEVLCIGVSYFSHKTSYCRTHNLRVCLYIAYIACDSASLFIKTLYFSVLVLSAAATVAKIKIRYDAKTPQFAIYMGHMSYMCSTVSENLTPVDNCLITPQNVKDHGDNDNYDVLGIEIS